MESQTTSKLPTRVAQKMNPVGLVLWFTGAARLYKDGDGFSAVWRWWHPVTWLLLVTLVLPCALIGQPLLQVVALRLAPYWRRRRTQVLWVTPFTRLSAVYSAERKHRPYRRESLLSAPEQG